MKHKLLITCITMDYPPMRGGVARYLHSLALAAKGQLDILLPNDHPKTRVIDSVNVERGRFWSDGWPKWWPLVGRCREVGRDRIILVSHVFPIGTAAWIASFFWHVEYIVLFHGTDLKRVKNQWKKFLLKEICRRSKLTMTNSQATAKALQRLVPSATPLILTPGVDEQPTIEKDAVRRVLGIDINTKVILLVARLVERKGIDVLIQAVAEIENRGLHGESDQPKSTTDIQVVVVGQGPYAEQLHQLANLMRVKVRWVENAEDADVQNWYVASDIFCLPAREEADDVEGFGMVLLEAAAAALPVIVGKGWGTGEAVEDGVTGLLVEPAALPVADALQKMLDDSALRFRLGQAGKERALRDFRWSDRWQKLEDSLGFSQASLDECSDISVVIPCYNHARELHSTLEALVKQTLKPAEVVVIDNGSNDNPSDVVRLFESRLPVSCVSFNAKRGAPAARNHGYKLTKEQFIIFLDADAKLKPQALEKMRKALELNQSASFAYSDFYWGNILFRGQTWSVESLKRKNWIHTSSLIRRQVLEQLEGSGPFDENLKKFQDWDLWLMLAEKNNAGVWIPEPLFKVIERKSGMSRWIPAFVHHLPWPILGWTPKEILRYRQAEKIIRTKHKIG